MPPASERELERWRCIADLLLKKDGGWRATVNKNDGFPTTARADKEAFLGHLQELHEVEGLRAALADVQRLPPGGFSDE